MRTPLTDHDPPYGRPTNRTRLALAIIHSKVVLKLAAAIHPVDAGTISPNALTQDAPDRFMQALGLGAGDRVGWLEWVQPGNVQRLVCVDIAQTGNKGLIQKQGLEMPTARMQPCVQHLGRERPTQGFRTEASGYRLCLVR